MVGPQLANMVSLCKLEKEVPSSRHFTSICQKTCYIVILLEQGTVLPHSNKLSQHIYKPMMSTIHKVPQRFAVPSLHLNIGLDNVPSSSSHHITTPRVNYL